MFHEWILVALLGTILLFAVLYYRRKVSTLEGRLSQKQTLAYRIGTHQARGDLAQILGTFGILGQYDDIIFLSTTSRQASLDLIGVRSDSIDFLEFKKKGAAVQPGERRLRQLVEQKKVEYKVLEVELPESVSVVERDL